MIKIKFCFFFAKNFAINSMNFLFKNFYFKNNKNINQIFFYKLLIKKKFLNKNLKFVKKKIFKNNICGSGGDGINLPNISTTDCLNLNIIKKKNMKNFGNSFLLKNGSGDYLEKINLKNILIIKNNFLKLDFIKIKNFLKFFFVSRKKYKLPLYFNIVNPFLNLIYFEKNINGFFSKKIFFYVKLLNNNFSINYNNFSDDIIQKKNIKIFQMKIFNLNNLQLNIKDIFFYKKIFCENFKFNIFNLKKKNNCFLKNKIFIINKIYKISFFFSLKFNFYFLLNNYYYKSIKKNYE